MLLLHYQSGVARDQLPIGSEPFQEWLCPNGTPWTQFYRRGADYLLRFPDLADFEVVIDSSTVRCWPTPGTPEDSLEHLYRNQVAPLVLSRQGHLILHGSAIEADGYALAFLAASGRGKSTLAASFAIQGYPLLSDDRLDVQATAEGIEAAPSHPLLRLWADSRNALFGTDARGVSSAMVGSKAHLLAGARLRFCREPKPLRYLYFLGEASAAPLAIRPLSAREALIELAQGAFLLDVEARELVAGHFERLSQLARLPIHFRLDYPRRFDALGDLRQAILHHSGCGPTGPSEPPRNS